ncbi:MAG TPA: TAXI family TRAP transporter solute-binding subunit [Methylomirabilota bacterium]|nr:TAXI family TRAP transporter solute-binding subunit [Methylomirabilota bacterium]
MLFGRQWRQWRIRDYCLVFGPALLLTGAAFAVAIAFMKPAPPRRIVLATGRSDGAYHQFGLRYQSELARSGVTVVLRQTSGSVENVTLLADPAGGVDVAFVQGGVGSLTPDAGLLALGSLYFEPLWVFARGLRDADDFRSLRGKRIAVGPEGSGTRALVDLLLRANGVTSPAATLLPLAGLDAVRALREQEVDAAVFVASPEAATVREAITVPGVAVMGFPRAEAYSRLYPFLSRLTLPEGALDLGRNLPAQEIVLLAPTTSLVTRSDFHPALGDLLLIAATKIHSRAGVFERPRQFPSQDFTDFPLSAEAQRFYQNGPPFLSRYLPFWAATLVDRLKIMLLPLIVFAIPLFKILPPTFRWRARRKIYTWYTQVQAADLALSKPCGADELDRLLGELDHVEEQVRRIRIPPAHSESHFHLRAHIDLVRAKLSAARAAVR